MNPNLTHMRTSLAIGEASEAKITAAALATGSAAVSPLQASVTGLRLEVLRVRAAEDLQVLEPHWDALLAKSAVRTPFMSWDWAELWWKHAVAECEAFLGAAWTDAGELAALVPLVVGPGGTSTRRRIRQLSFFGGLGDVVSEGLDLMVLPGCEAVLPELLNRVFGTMAGEWDIAHFGFLDLKSPFYETLRQALNQHGEQVRLVNAQESPFTQWTDQGWEPYFMRRSPSFRRKYRRLVAESQRTYQVTYRELERPEEAARYLEDLMTLHERRWSSEQSLFLSPTARAFHAALLKRWCVDRRAMLLVLEFDGRPVAANYAFRDGDRLWDYQGGWNPEFIELSPSKLIMAENIRRAMALGVREMDMLPGDVDYKRKWTEEHRMLADLEAVNPRSMRAAVFQAMRAVKRTLNQFLPSEPRSS